MGNQVGHPQRSAENDLYADRFGPDYQAPRQPFTRPTYDGSPLYRPPPQLSPLDEEMEAKQRAISADCIIDTVEFIKYPTMFGLLFGAAQAASVAAPDISQYRRVVVSGWSEAGKGFLRELKFLKMPTLMLGGYAGLYSIVSCSIAKYQEYDGIFNSAVAAAVTGAALGLQQRCPNRMFAFAFWGSFIGAACKWEYLNQSLMRPQRTYYELKDARKRYMRAELAEEMEDGYLHRYLDPQLESMGLKVPDSWKAKQ